MLEIIFKKFWHFGSEQIISEKTQTCSCLTDPSLSAHEHKEIVFFQM